MRIILTYHQRLWRLLSPIRMWWKRRQLYKETKKLVACDYCICWFCNLRKTCPVDDNRCKFEETSQCKNQAVVNDFYCTEADFGDDE